jgi:ParB/RepB/Spo0J family partition protein
MSDVDLLQNSEEAVDQREEEAAREEREAFARHLAAAPLADTASKPHSDVEVPLKDISAIVNMRSSLPSIETLALNIKEHGLINPLTVQETGDDERPYRLIAGQRRLAALRKLDPAGEMIVRCEVIDGLDSAEVLDLQLAENSYDPPEPIDYARAVRRLMAERPDWSASDIARRHGVKPDWVQRHLRLLDLPEAVLSKLQSGDLTFTVADLIRRGLRRGEIDETDAAEAAELAAEGDLSTDDVRELTGHEMRTVDGNVVGEGGYVPEAPEGYDEISRELDQARWDARRGESVQTADDDWGDEVEDDWGDGGAGAGTGPSPRSAYSDAANTTGRATVGSGPIGEVQPETLERYLLGRLLRDAGRDRLEEFGLVREGVWPHVFSLSDEQVLAELHRLSLSMLADDDAPPAELFAR